MRYLTITHKLIVYIYIMAGVDAFKVQKISFCFLFVKRKGTAIKPAWIFFRYIRRIKRNRIEYICILVRIVTFHLPVGWNFNFVITLRLHIKIAYGLKKMKIPYAVKHHNAGIIRFAFYRRLRIAWNIIGTVWHCSDPYCF